MNTQQPTVVIGIPTFKRPIGLRRLLESLAKLETSVKPTVLVVDNDAEGQQGMKVVQELQQAGYRWPLKLVLEAERGISQARNKLLSEGFGTLKADFLAMVDDDTWVESQWLQALLDMQTETGVDVVGGFVQPKFPDGEPDWVKNSPLYYHTETGDGARDCIHATTSVLLSVNLSKIMPKMSFDPSFSLTGGGDDEFFTRAKSFGATFSYTSKSLIYEDFDSNRVKPGWALMRAYRIAIGNMRVMRLHCNKWHLWLKQILLMFCALGCGLLMTIALWWHPRLSMRGPLMLARQLGKVSGAMGFVYHEYKVTHGR